MGFPRFFQAVLWTLQVSLGTYMERECLVVVAKLINYQ